MSDWYRDRDPANARPGDVEWRGDADRRWDPEDARARNAAERRAFDAGPAPRGRPEPRPRSQQHRGYRLGPYGRPSDFGAPDYVEAGRGYGGALYENAPYQRGYGEERYIHEGRRPQPQGYGDRYARGGDGADAFQGDNTRLQRVSDGEAGHGHLFGGGHRGRGPKGYSRSDTRIHDDLADHLAADPDLDASEIEVTVKDGEVTLSGHVPRREDRRHAENLADHVLGVKHVQNNLRVQATDTSARATGLR